MACVLPREPEHEARVVGEVALPQPARLLGEAEEPLQAGGLHPGRGLRDEAGVEVERGADADEHGRVDAVAQRGHPLLLLGHADADPHDVGLGVVDLGDDGVDLLVAERAERRRVAADDLQAVEAPAQVERELDERALVAAAVEEHPRTGEGAALAELRHQVRAVDAVGEVVAERVHRPDDGLAVGDDERGVADRGAQLRVVLRGDHRVGRGDADVALALLLDGGVHPVHRALVIGERERDPEDVDSGRRNGGISGEGRAGVVDGGWGEGHAGCYNAPTLARFRCCVGRLSSSLDETDRNPGAGQLDVGCPAVRRSTQVWHTS